MSLVFYPSKKCKKMAAEEGFEPSHTESESAVLPLHHSAVFIHYILADDIVYVNIFLIKNKIIFLLIEVVRKYGCFCLSVGG